jgi:acetylornithine deacetylase/succinyl-diaminopimelate desuccinylase-like protein
MMVKLAKPIDHQFPPGVKMLSHVLQTIDSRKHQSVSALTEFLSIPSVSTKPEHAPDMRRAAQWLADQFKFAALDVSVMPTGGHPAVVAKNKHIPGRPTVLLYGHYDVQPPEPLEEWITPPFTPTVRDNAIYARGAVDDKGQVWAHAEAIMAWQAHGGLPINLTVLIEGEEEIGSENLEAFVAKHKDALRADIALVSDTNQFARGIPSINYGLRGLVYMEVFLSGPDHDLHSGLYGGAVPNPPNVLAELLATLHDKEGRVNLPHFYDDVIPLTDAERQMWKSLPFDEKSFAAELKLSSLYGEAGYSTIERQWARPTCDINGLTSGYQGHGAKTIIPAKASAKVSMRLVPNQNPHKIADIFEQTLRERCPANVQIRFARHGLAPAVLVPMDSPAMRLAASAVETGFGKKPVLTRGGGSIPVVGLFKKELNLDTLLVGFGLPDDRVHSPNEKFDLDCLYNGSRTAAALYEQLSDLK